MFWAAAGEEVVVRVDFLVAGFQRVYLDDGQHLLIRLGALEDLARGRDETPLRPRAAVLQRVD